MSKKLIVNTELNSIHIEDLTNIPCVIVARKEGKIIGTIVKPTDKMYAHGIIDNTHMYESNFTDFIFKYIILSQCEFECIGDEF